MFVSVRRLDLALVGIDLLECLVKLYLEGMFIPDRYSSESRVLDV